MAAPKRKVSQATKIMPYTANGNRFIRPTVCNPLVDTLSVGYKGRS